MSKVDTYFFQNVLCFLLFFSFFFFFFFFENFDAVIFGIFTKMVKKDGILWGGST